MVRVRLRLTDTDTHLPCSSRCNFWPSLPTQFSLLFGIVHSSIILYLLDVVFFPKSSQRVKELRTVKNTTGMLLVDASNYKNTSLALPKPAFLIAVQLCFWVRTAMLTQATLNRIILSFTTTLQR